MHMLNLVMKLASTIKLALRKLRTRLKRRTFQLISLCEFRQSNPCRSLLHREADSVETHGPRFVTTNFNPAAPSTVRVISPVIEILEFSHAAVVGGTNLVIVGRQAIHPDIVEPSRDMFLAEVEGTAKVHHSARQIHLNLRKRRMRVTAAASLIGECTGNYAHWLFETLPKLIILDEYEKFRSLPLLVDGWIHPIFYQSLALLNTYCRPLIRVDRWQMANAEHLIYITPPSYVAPENRLSFGSDKRPKPSPDAFSFSPPELSALRSKAVAAARNCIATGRTSRTLPDIIRVDCRDDVTAVVRVPKPPSDLDVTVSMAKRIYLRRVASTAGNPRFLLEQSRIESILADFAFVAVDPASLSFAEQVLLLQNVECVVAPVGAALANLLFAPPGRRVIALAPFFPNADYYYFSNMMGVLGHEIRFVLGPQLDQPNVHVLHRDYFVDLHALKKVLIDFCR